MRKNYPSFEEKFWSKVSKAEENACWEWSGALRWNGYGVFRHLNKSVLAHRASFIIHKGPIPDGCVICHSCDNRKCCNPNHLWSGTQKENLQDMFNKNRDAKSKPKGSCQNHPRAKLKNTDIDIIKNEYKSGISSRIIAKKYNVSKRTILNVVQGKNWRHYNEN